MENLIISRRITSAQNSTNSNILKKDEFLEKMKKQANE